MAKAPRPGVTKRDEQTATAQRVMKITISRDITTKDGRLLPHTHSIGIDNIPMREQIVARKATGLPVSAFMADERIGEDSVMVMWWLARRMNGEPWLEFGDAANEWPTVLLVSEFDLELVTPDDPRDAEVVDPEA